jgi:hypothetical protein
VKETYSRTARRVVIETIALACLLAVALPALEGDTGALSGALLGVSAALLLDLRRVVRWERANGVILWRERKIQWSGLRLLRESKHPPARQPA